MKKFVSLIAVFLLVASCLAACSRNPQETVAPTVQETEATPKDEDYLYDWLTEHGTLVDDTCLQYSGTDASGTKFTLCYDTEYVEKLRWRVQYGINNPARRTTTTLYLFCDFEETFSNITVSGSGAFSGYYRSLEYYHDPTKFTHNSPIEIGEYDGSTVVREVWVPGQGLTTKVDPTEGLQEQLDIMDNACRENAQKNLCKILDWLKDSFCPTANMTMTDFGYEKY